MSKEHLKISMPPETTPYKKNLIELQEPQIEERRFREAKRSEKSYNFRKSSTQNKIFTGIEEILFRPLRTSFIHRLIHVQVFISIHRHSSLDELFSPITSACFWQIPSTNRSLDAHSFGIDVSTTSSDDALSMAAAKIGRMKHNINACSKNLKKFISELCNSKQTLA
jgi:hypothetical protein